MTHSADARGSISQINHSEGDANNAFWEVGFTPFAFLIDVFSIEMNQNALRRM